MLRRKRSNPALNPSSEPPCAARPKKPTRSSRLHARPGAFVIPNPWDAGTAKLLAAMGFEALATTSLGFANTLGTAEVSLDAIIENCRTIAAATDLPVSADLENCGADEPKAAARAIGLAAEAGAVGGSIEDSTGDPQAPIYDFTLAVERVQAAVEAARALPFPFTLTARAENLLHGRNDLDDTIRRLQAFEAVGADVLYSPGVRDLDTIRNGGRSARQAVQPGDGLCRPHADRRPAFRRGRQAHQRRRRDVAFCTGRLPAKRARDEGQGGVQLRHGNGADQGTARWVRDGWSLAFVVPANAGPITTDGII